MPPVLVVLRCRITERGAPVAVGRKGQSTTVCARPLPSSLVTRSSQTSLPGLAYDGLTDAVVSLPPTAGSWAFW